jgi:hypothetical protein
LLLAETFISTSQHEVSTWDCDWNWADSDDLNLLSRCAFVAGPVCNFHDQEDPRKQHAEDPRKQQAANGNRRSRTPKIPASNRPQTATVARSKASPKTQHEAASKFFRQTKVRTRILELQAQVASQSVTAAALTLDAHMEMLRELRDKADQRGQTSAAIRAEELRGQLRRFYVKQVETAATLANSSAWAPRNCGLTCAANSRRPRAQSSTDFLHVVGHSPNFRPQVPSGTT